MLNSKDQTKVSEEIEYIKTNKKIYFKWNE